MALLLLFLLPLLAGVLIPLLPDRPGLARGVALVAPVLQLITAAWLWRHPPGELVVDWLPRLGLVLEAFGRGHTLLDQGGVLLGHLIQFPHRAIHLGNAFCLLSRCGCNFANDVCYALH